MSPAKKTPKQAEEKWAKGIKAAADTKAFSKGVKQAGAASFAGGVEKAGDASWASGVAKAADGKRWSKKAIAAATDWVNKTSAAEKDWAAKTIAAQGDFAEKIAKVIPVVNGCLEITPEAIEAMMREYPGLTGKQVKAIIFQNCMSDAKSDGKFD